MMMSAATIPAEWAPQQAVMVGFPSHHTLWPGLLLAEAQLEVAALCNIIAEAQTCYVLAANAASATTAKRLITNAARIIEFPFGDIWLRDISPIFTSPQQGLRFKHNGWGGKYLYPYDDCMAERLASYFELDAKAFDFVLEGGALEHNGEGEILTTRQCIVNKNRNQWREAEAEAQIKAAFNATRLYWLDEGLTQDHTDGHIDNIARFVNTDTVLCQHSNGESDPNRALYQTQPACLQAQGLGVVTVPSPGLIRDANNDIMPASHLNFIMTNEHVVFPNYLKYHRTEKYCVHEAQDLLSALFPGREIVTLPSNAVLTGGGSFHCISQHIPA